MQKPQTTQPSKTDVAQEKLLKMVLWLIVPLIGLVIWWAPDNGGFITHNEMTLVNSANWQTGESKTCTTINGNGLGAPDRTKERQRILCDGEAPSDGAEGAKLAEDTKLTDNSKLLKVRFEGRTYVAPKDVSAVLRWNCRRDAPDADPPITCHPEFE